MAQKIQIRVKITGRVQGVCFRAGTKTEADRLGLKGWVKNQSDGSVEAVFEGDPVAVAQMADWCRQGPFPARVDHVLIDAEETASGFTRFDILY